MNVVEGPWIIHWDKYYYLFYSSRGFKDPKYSQLCARSKHVTGPYVKSTKPVVAMDSERSSRGVNTTWTGPGHGCVVQDHIGSWWLVYHAWVVGKIGDESPGRQMMLDKLSLDEEGWPKVEDCIPSDRPRLRPDL